ncbi:MAG: tetratricopeptide repeat protein [Phycisphaerae bacterium]|nr:tetratricopeptide repeat protein [Phycisphaerae bacterium]
MSSLLPGFEYDIFISYRHNDNRSDWVTDFVNALQEELAATIKEPLSTYFDKNPHDGLLETHSVDKSLEGKLKCLIFIPIISQTYCDTKSFAWQHEFCAFNKLAKEDQFGRDIKLGNGNVVSRILPIKIHDLDADDKVTIESEIGSVLRAIEFIFKSPGVNRPLTSTDNPDKNLNQTYYRDQINKVANAIKEIISALQKPDPIKSPVIPSQQQSTHPKKSNNKILWAAIAAIAIIVLSYLGYSKFFPSAQPVVEIEKSVAVLPFADLSPEGNQEYLGDGISEEIINVLAQSPDLKVIARSSSFQFKDKNEDLRTIGKMLGVSTILEGSVRKYKDQIRVTAQLIKAEDGSHFWSKNFDQNTDNIFVIQDGIAAAVAEALKVTLLEGKTSKHQTTVNPEAYRLYQIGRSFYDRADPKDRELAIHYFEQSVKADSTFASAWSYLSICYQATDDHNKALLYNKKALALDPNEPDALVNQILYTSNDLRFKDAYQLLLSSLKLKLEVSRMLRQQGQCFFKLGFYEDGINYCKRAVALDPLQAFSHGILGDALAAHGKFAEAEASYRREFEINKRPWALIYIQILQKKLTGIEELMALDSNEPDSDFYSGDYRRDFCYSLIYSMEGRYDKANKFLDKIKSKGDAFRLAEIYAFLGEKDEAFRWLEKAVNEKDEQLEYFKASPFLISLRNDQRFKALSSKLNFPE